MSAPRDEETDEPIKPAWFPVMPFEQTAKSIAEHCGCEAADAEAIILRELRDAYRLGLKEGKPQPWTKNHCDLCQEPMEGRGPWHWVEEGWSLACDRCWNLIAAQMKR